MEKNVSSPFPSLHTLLFPPTFLFFQSVPPSLLHSYPACMHTYTDLRTMTDLPLSLVFSVFSSLPLYHQIVTISCSNVWWNQFCAAPAHANHNHKLSNGSRSGSSSSSSSSSCLLLYCV